MGGLSSCGQRVYRTRQLSQLNRINSFAHCSRHALAGGIAGVELFLLDCEQDRSVVRKILRRVNCRELTRSVRGRRP
jgi:hypothetical protein